MTANYIDAMKQALEALGNCESMLPEYHQWLSDAQYEVRAAIEAAEKQEPVAKWDETRGVADRLGLAKIADETLLYTTPQPAIPAGMVLVPVELPDKARQAIWVQGWNEVDDFWKRCLEELAAAPKPENSHD